MSVVNTVKATCHKCSTKNNYYIILSWNSVFGEMPVYENKCKNCGYALQYEDTEPIHYSKKNYKISFNQGDVI